MLCGGVSERQPGRAPRVRLSLALAGIAAAALTALAALAGFELALARAPAWRASLEQLVRARTGFAVQFQRLGVRWGWYGPEAVFHGVELADAQRSGLRMHAAQLIVRLDAWHSVQSGQLEAGRITLVGADIDLVRRGPAAARQAPAVAPFDSLAALRAVIAHWPNGRIDLEGGTLRLPAARASPLMLSVRRAMLQRSDDSWSAFADALLPQGLGRSVRIAVTFGGAAARGAPARGASGTLRLDVRGAQLAGGRALLALAGECAPQACALLPQQGETDLNARLDWRAGVFSGASGEFEAQRLRLAAPVATDLALRAGHFALVRAREGWQLSLGRVRAQATVDGLRLAGDIPTLLADWSAARVRGARLQYVASVQALALGRPGDRLALEGLQARLAGTESALEVQLSSAHARLFAAGRPGAVAALRVDALWRAQRSAQGWSVATDRTLLAQGRAQLSLAAQVRSFPGAGSAQIPLVRLHALLTDAGVESVRALLDERTAGLLGPAAARLQSGQIGRAELLWEAPLGASPAQARVFAGSVSLREGVLAPQGDSPGVRDIDGRLVWRGQSVRAVLASARSGPFQLSAVNAQWHEDGAGLWRVSGQARGRIEAVLAWLRAHPDLGTYAAAADGLQARGQAQFDFSAEVAAQVPAAKMKLSERPAALQARVTARLQAEEVLLAAQLPPLHQVQGTLELDSAHLRSALLTGRWLGGTVELSAAQHIDADRPVLTVHARGVLDGARAVALAGLGLDPTRVSGSSRWWGELEFAPARDREPRAWAAHFETPLEGIASALPEPLAKRSEGASAVRVDLVGAARQARVQVTVGAAVSGALQLVAGADGAFHPRAAVLNVGSGAPGTLGPPHNGLFRVQARVHRLDLAAWLALWRAHAQGPGVLPLQADVTADELQLAGQVYPGAVLHLAQGQDYELSIDSRALAGQVAFPRAPAEPLRVHLDRLVLPDHPVRSAGGLAVLLGHEATGVLGSGAILAIDQVTWRGAPIGSLSARLAGTGQDELKLESLRLAAPAQQLQGSLACSASARECALEFELTSTDAAATLASLGVEGGLSAARARVRGELAWPLGELQDERTWAARLHGHVALNLEDGEARTDAPGPGFALLAVADLLRGAPGRGPAEPVHFSRLSADYDLHDGNAFTSDLHFDGDAEILMSGRAGLIARDFDYRAQILRGEERLPAALRRLATAPRVAAAWLALRDLISGPHQDSRVALRLSGSWDAPEVEAVRP